MQMQQTQQKRKLLSLTLPDEISSKAKLVPLIKKGAELDGKEAP